jgi:hypothetical protein
MCSLRLFNAAVLALKILLSATTVFTLTCNAESVTRSEAQTAGEKRILEWDLSKTYDISHSRMGPGTKKHSRSFEARALGSGVFPTRAFSVESFCASEFLSASPRHQTKDFPITSPLTTSAAVVSKTSLADKPSRVPKAVPTLVNQRPFASEKFSDATRVYQGVEALRKDRVYLPENAPRGGVIEGRRLTIDEVKQILNKSK